MVHGEVPQEFVAYLLATETGGWNHHWRPFHSHCTPCIANFTAIAHLENHMEVSHTREE